VFTVTIIPVGHTHWWFAATPSWKDLKDNGVVAMEEVLTEGANEKPFAYDHQHGHDDVTCKPRTVFCYAQAINVVTSTGVSG